MTVLSRLERNCHKLTFDLNVMGNRPCAALCYDVDHRQSVHESTNIVNKSSALWAQQMSADFDDENVSTRKTGNNDIRDKREREEIHRLDRLEEDVSKQLIPPPHGVHQSYTDEDNEPRQPKFGFDSHPSSAYYYTGLPSDVRSMSSDTSGREARSELNLSRRSSGATCEREDIADEICANRSSS